MHMPLATKVIQRINRRFGQIARDWSVTERYKSHTGRIVLANSQMLYDFLLHAMCIFYVTFIFDFEENFNIYTFRIDRKLSRMHATILDWFHSDFSVSLLENLWLIFIGWFIWVEFFLRHQRQIHLDLWILSRQRHFTILKNRPN